MLDRTRLFVASSSNFGAPLARRADAASAVLSIDVSSGSIAVPPNFASADGQATASGAIVAHGGQAAAAKAAFSALSPSDLQALLDYLNYI